VFLLVQPVAAQQTAPLDQPSYVLMEAGTGRVIDSTWDTPSQPGPIGSLVKPFTALAYGAAHEYRYPTVTCRGTAGRCWLPEGHGPIGIVEAIAHSCNEYFFALAQAVTGEAFAATLRLFGLDADARASTPETMVGLGDDLRVSPRALASAYLELASRAAQPGVRPILLGMQVSARQGTGAGAGRAVHLADALVKTGTSPCAHSPRATADGHAVVLYPADRPRVVLVVRAHGRTGADTATLAGQILAASPEAR
jgi:cell division protein FtsI/penicillin-binding protein 2